MIEKCLDTIARNYLRAEECERLANEFKYACEVKIKTYDSKGKCKGKYQTISTDLLGKAFERMAEDYKKRSVEMLQHQMEIQE